MCKNFSKKCFIFISKSLKKFYPNADLDYPDKSIVDSNKISSKYNTVTFGKNIFIGKKSK